MPPATVLLVLVPTLEVDVFFEVVAVVRPVVAVPPLAGAVVAVVLSVVSAPVDEVVAAGSTVVPVPTPSPWADFPFPEPPPHAATIIPATPKATTARQELWRVDTGPTVPEVIACPLPELTC
jgi:hypothetical protein